MHDTVSNMLWHVDRRQWQDVKECLAQSVRVDYTSLNGGEPGTVGRDDLVAGWASALGGFAATQHLLAPSRVSLSGDQARLEANFVATHSLTGAFGASLWTLGGFYTLELTRTDAGWRIGGLTMTATWGAGNRQPAVDAARRSESAV